MLLFWLVLVVSVHYWHISQTPDLPAIQPVLACHSETDLAVILHAWKHDGHTGLITALAMYHSQKRVTGISECWLEEPSDPFIAATEIWEQYDLDDGEDGKMHVYVSEATSWLGERMYTISAEPIVTVQPDPLFPEYESLFSSQ